jgi:c(7)-type cytochrome triheme protein
MRGLSGVQRWLIVLGIALAGMTVHIGLLVANPATVQIERVEEADEGPVVFGHWKHQESYQCYACHNNLFSMDTKTAFTHEDMDEGKFCGACHNGKVAPHPDDDAFGCESCHVE